MKRTNVTLCATVAIAVVLAVPVSACAQTAGEVLYKAKCAACHGPDGSGSAVGKKMGAHDFRSSEVQTQSDAALIGIIANEKKTKCPPIKRA